MHLSSFITTLAFAIAATASPACKVPKPSPNPNQNPNLNPNPNANPDPNPSTNVASGKDANGSIFKFGDPEACRDLFWQDGACGLSTYFPDSNPNKLSLVALPKEIFLPHGQSQNNKLCGKVITMTYKGVTKQALVADVNMSDEKSIDMCLDIWQAFGGRNQDGTLRRGIEWSIAA